MTNRIALLSALLAAAACGDNPGTPDARVTTDGHLGSDGGIDSGSGSGSGSGSAAQIAVAFAGDFGAAHPGVLAKLDTATLTVTQGLAPTGAVGDNPVVRHVGHELFVVNSADGNNVTILDDQTFAVVEQLATGANSNPQDVAVVGQKLYVPVYGGKGVAVLTRGSATIATVDLSAFDTDGKPECASAFAVGTDVYVTCQLLDGNFSPRANGKVAVIDTATDTLRTSFNLTTMNPLGLLEAGPAGKLLVATVVFGANNGCIEEITTGATPTSTCLVTNTKLGGYTNRLASLGAQVLADVIGPGFPPAFESIVSFDVATTTPTTVTAVSEAVSDLAVCPDGTLVVSDMTAGAAGLRVYGSAGERTTAALPIGLPPAAAHGLQCY